MMKLIRSFLSLAPIGGGQKCFASIHEWKEGLFRTTNNLSFTTKGGEGVLTSSSQKCSLTALILNGGGAATQM